MPQMAPAMWLPMFMVMFMITLLTLTAVYFSENLTPEVSSNAKSNFNSISWLW